MDNSTLARAACSFSYSKPARHNPDTGANPRTKLYATVYDTLLKAKDTQKAAPKAWNVQGRDCGRAVLCAVLWSGVDDSMPRTVAKMREHMEKSECWKDLGKWNGKESSLQPGDVLIRVKGVDGAKSNHVSVYVGHDTASEIYSKHLKGTDADKGAPASDAAWASAFLSGGNPPDKGYAPCIGNAKYASVDKTMHVFRCVNPQGSDKYTGIGKAQPAVSEPTVAQPIVSQPQGGGMLRVVDIASHQEGIDPAALDCDIVIVKATGGTSYVNPLWREWADAVLASGKQLGLYHYCMEYGHFNEARDEARYFLDRIADYKGRCVPILDFEADAQSLPVSWAREWMDTVAAETGSTPVFYAYASYLNSRDHSEIAGYPLWMASYLCRYDGVGWVDDPLNTWATGNWDRMTMYQYTSTGRIWGYDGRLDLSVFYGDENDWNALIGGGGMVIDTTRIDKLCDAMRWAADSDQVGYSQSDRWEVEFFGGGQYNADCSSLVIQAARYAGYDTGSSTFTGNMSAEFCARGWTRVPADGNPQKGYILLSDANHVAVWLGDCLAQASIDEHGNIAGGARGDQTGAEVNTRSYYDYPWDCYLVPPTDYKLGALDMAEALFYIDDDHMGYKKDDVIYWNPTAGFCFLEHPDCIELLKTCSKGIAEVHSQSVAPWIERARLATNPQVAAETFGKRN